MVDAVDDGVEDFHPVDRTDEANDLFAKLDGRGLGNAGSKGIEKAPAVWLAHQDHPLPGIGEIGKIRVIAGIGDVEIDFDVDQQAALVGGLSFHRHTELRAHRAAPAVTGQEIRAFHFARAVRGFETRDDAMV
jgi:hypothetical protein